MKPELRKMFDAAETQHRGLLPDEIASVLNSTERGTDARAEAIAMINGGQARTPEGRDALRKLLEDDAKTAAEYAEHRARTEAFEAEIRALAAKAGPVVMPIGSSGLPGESDGWRSVLPSGNEFRALVAEGSPGSGGYAVPSKTADKYVEHLRAASVFLRVPGINIHRFDGGSFVLPNLTSSTTPGVVAEGAAIPEGTATFAGLTFAPIKYADLYRASNEVLDDAAFEMRSLISGVMVRNIATQVDRDAFQGTGTASLSGLTKAGMGTAVNLSTGNTVVKWDHVIDAFSDIEAAGAIPAVIWASPDMGKALRKERENGANGGYLAGQVTDRVAEKGLGLPIYVSANLPAKTVIVADPSRIHIGVRSDVRVAVSEDFGFDKDLTAFRTTYRVAGLAVDATAAVQVIKASAS
ncbi:phage major capsid protein [Streptomyces scabiei]|uniref:phage major capsid protein n=1 Tax=Streptomyces scabiei TaxID=1930 RepID=UPI0029B19233|nr:phage major capsid protein [Streptomyces scabiei]MDX2891941.1 phage major capsid protein [Streptomyces scabiei]MDX2900150.1 phage major capsid protein [Streptomyces scabiei]